MRGLKLHFGNSGVSLRNPAHAERMAEVFAVAGRHRAPILVHMRARGGKEFGAEDARLFLDKLVPKRRTARSSSPISAARVRAIRTRPTR